MSDWSATNYAYGQASTKAGANLAAGTLRAECEREDLSWMQRSARLTRRQCESERVVIEPDERIVFTRTLAEGTLRVDVPEIYSPVDWEKLTGKRTLHELGPISNICAD